MTATPRTRVAILGGGLGAITAAFELTATPALRERFDVTVYTQGWRLGGKGATGRNLRVADRIEEHGLHVFLGFYERTFGLVQRAYGEWQKQPDNPFQTWSDAFDPGWLFTLQESPADTGAGWETWNITLPTLPGMPGDGAAMPTPGGFLVDLVAWIQRHLAETPGAPAAATAAPSPRRPPSVDALVAQARGALGALPAPVGHHPVLTEAHHVATWFESEVGAHTPEAHAGLLGLFDEFRAWIAAEVRPLRDMGTALRRLWVLLDIGCAAARGLLEDVLPPWKHGFDGINDQDFKDWLQRHGLTADNAWSAPLRALYDLGFAFVGGEATRECARSSAGASLKISLLMELGYKHAPLWKMRAGMGETVFSPLYQVLLQRGVRVEFFQRVQNLALAPDGDVVQRVELSRQAELAGATYDPLVTVRGLPCWPSTPRWSQLKHGEALEAAGPNLESAWCLTEASRHTLEYGRDFDRIVLGIPAPALRDVAPELLEASIAWRTMVDKLQSVQTQSSQLWMIPTLAALGWDAGTTVSAAYAEPLDTWGEMSQLIPRENWPASETPGSEQYLLGPLKDPPDVPPYTDAGYPARVLAEARATLRTWLDTYTGHVWPKATRPDNPDGLDWNTLLDLEHRTGVARLDAQYVRVNVDPTERYILTVPGSVPARLAPGASGFGNVVLAGDWTATSLNAGCAEAAVESGQLAAQALIAGPQSAR